MQPRIVSLIASSTEIVCALGFERNLVGRSHECDYPELVKDLPACTSPKVKVERKSAEIDRDVKALLENALSVYRVDADLLRSLRPTHIITQAHCEVCAVSLKDVERALKEWSADQPQESRRPALISLEPNGLPDVFEDIGRVAAALGVPARGRHLVESMSARLESVERKARALRKPTVACIEWIDPLMAAGNWMPDLVAMAGGRNLFGEAGKHSPGLAWDELRGKGPDVLFICPCGFDLRRTREEMPAMAARAGWNELPAVMTRQTFIGDGNQYFNRPGPRLAESIEILAEVIHPDVFRFGYEGKGWERW